MTHTGIPVRLTGFTNLHLLDAFVLGIKVARIAFGMLGSEALTRLSQVMSTWRNGTNPDVIRLRRALETALPKIRTDPEYLEIMQRLQEMSQDEATKPNRLSV